jgi:hypothetical protein
METVGKHSPMDNIHPSRRAVLNSIGSAIGDVIFAPIEITNAVLFKMTMKLAEGIENRSVFLQNREKKRELSEINKFAASWTTETFTDPNRHSAAYTARRWAEKVGASAEAEKAYAEKQYVWQVNQYKYFDHIGEKPYDPTQIFPDKNNLKQIKATARQMEIGVSAEVKEKYAKKAWTEAKRHKSANSKAQTEYAYELYIKFLRFDKYLESWKKNGGMSQEAKAEELYHGFTNPLRLNADRSAEQWAQFYAVDDVTKKAYSDMLFENALKNDKKFTAWVSGKQGASFSQAENTPTTESRLSIAHLRKAIRNYSHREEIRREILTREAFNSIVQLRETPLDKYFPSAQRLTELAEKPLNKAILPKVQGDFSEQQLTSLMKSIDEYRDTLKNYANKIRQATESGQPLKLTNSQFEELNIAESMMGYYTYKPNVIRSSFKQGYAR